MEKFKNPSSLYQVAYNEAIDEMTEEVAFTMGLIEREEAFKRELLDKALVPLNNLATSISDLAASMNKQASRPIINLFIDKNMEPDKIVEVIGRASELLK